MPDNSYFQSNPTRLDISRSKYTLHPRWTGTWSTGKLVPIFATSSIMPGDTVSLDVSAAIRTITPIFPVMDDMDITVEAFFVPHRLILSRKSMSPDVNDSNHSWAAFLGAQDSLLNMPVPSAVTLPRNAVGTYSSGTYDMYKKGGLADCLGFAPPQSTAIRSYFVNALKPLAYYSVWNEFFRDPNTMSPVTYTINGSGFVEYVGTDANITYNNGSNQFIQQFPLAPVCRYHGYFGSALPWPLRNTVEMTLPLGNSEIPVRTTGDIIPIGTKAAALQLYAVSSMNASGIGDPHAADSVDRLIGMAANSTIAQSTGYTGSFGNGAFPANLWANLGSATGGTINQFRTIVQMQRWYEALARGGNKLEDLTYSMFGVRGPEVATRPEYLGGIRIPISISQVAATANTGAGSGVMAPGNIGSTGAFSLTNLNNFLFTKSFTEHGTLMVVACCRVHDSFGQGIQREDTKVSREEFYWPQYANLGEQSIKVKELYVDGTSANDEAVFGYQEAWAEYRMIPDQVTGYIRPGNNMDMITYANNFLSAPTLKSFLSAESQVDNVDKTIQVVDSVAGFQFYGQFQFNLTMTRPMPLYSVPGLVDHH